MRCPTASWGGHTPAVSPPIGSLRTSVRDPRRRRLAFLFVFTLVLSFVPMAGTLGYFSSLVLAPIVSLLAAAAGVDAVARVRERSPAPADGEEATGLLAREAARELSWLVGLPLAVLLLGMLWNTNCDPLGGLAFHVIGPGCSAVLGFVAGIGTSVLLPPLPRWRRLLAGWLPFLVCIAIGVWRLYFDPAVYAFDPFVGWFSGPIYDEGIAIGPRYLRYRAYNFVAATAVWLFVRASVDGNLRASAKRLFAGPRNRVRTACAIVLAILALGLGLSSARLGFSATVASLSESLGATRETEHFVIHYGPTSATAREIDMVAAEHEFAWHRLEQRLGHAPDRKVHSFVFASGKQRGQLIGANVVEVSPPWRQQMYLSHRTWPHDVLPHELAHAFLGDFGDRLLGLPISGLRVNGALIEGVPTALAPRSQDNLSLHEQAAVLDRLDKRPPLSAIMGAGFWGAAASRAYTASGSFVLWLAQTHDWASVAQLYDNAGDFQATYGKSLAELEDEWLVFLRSLPLREQDIAAQAQRFQRMSVFRRPCAHRAAELRSTAARARLLGQQDDALEIQRTLCRIEPDDPAHFLGLAEMLAGWERFSEAAQVLDELAARSDLTATIRGLIDEQRGDTALMAGQLGAAATHYEAALALGLGENRARQLQIKLMATQNPELAPLVAEYFGPFRVEDESHAAAVLQLWRAHQIAGLPGHRALGNYLLGRQLLIASAPGEAASVLAEALAPPLGEPTLSTPELRRAAMLAQVSALTQSRDWAGARAWLGPLRELAEGDGHREVIDEWAERIDFFEAWFSS
jgi:hypothetical protein